VAWLVRSVLVAPLRAVVLVRGAAALGLGGPDARRRAVAAAVVEIVTGALCAVALGAATLPVAALAAAVAVQGALPAVVLLLGAATLVAWAASIAVRALLLPAFVRTVVHGHGVVRALRDAGRHAGGTLGF